METEQMAKVIDPERLDFAKEHLVLEENVAYADQHERQIMDLIYPEQHSGKMPVIIWIHGGGWSDEVLDKRYRPELQLGELAKMGFFIASIEYRLCQHAPFPAQIQDCKCAVRFLRANAEKYQIDPDHIGVWGESAGGHLASLLGAAGDVAEFEGDGGYAGYSSRVQAVCPWYAPNDMLVESMKDQSKDSVFYRLFGGTVEEKKELIWSASPMKYVKEKLPPYLLMHGTVDKLVPYSQSKNFYEALIENGNEAQLVTVEGQGHGFFDGDEYYDMIYAFFKEHLMA